MSLPWVTASVPSDRACSLAAASVCRRTSSKLCPNWALMPDGTAAGPAWAASAWRAWRRAMPRRYIRAAMIGLGWSDWSAWPCGPSLSAPACSCSRSCPPLSRPRCSIDSPHPIGNINRDAGLRDGDHSVQERGRLDVVERGELRLEVGVAFTLDAILG